MTSQRLVNQLIKVAIEDFNNEEEVDVKDIGVALKKHTKRILWSSNEIAGAMPKVSNIFVPTGEKNRYKMNTFIVKKEGLVIE